MTQHSSVDPLARRGALWLALFGIASTAVYAAAMLRFPLLTLYARQRFVLRDYTKLEPGLVWPMTVGILLLFAAYALGFWLLKRLPRVGRGVALVVVLVPLVCTTIAFFTQTITSTDMYDYLFRGRMIARYGANTFVEAPHLYENDPMFPYVVWRNAVTAYGPLWEAMSLAAARIVGEAPNSANGTTEAVVLNLMIAYKALATIGYLLCGAAIWGALGWSAPQYRWAGLYLWLWNPLNIWESVVAAHNDVWMVLPIILAVWALMPRHGTREVLAQRITYQVAHNLTTRSYLALFALTIGGLIKYLALLLGPLALAASLRRLPTWGWRIGLLVFSGIAFVALMVIGYAPFWVGPETFANFEARRNLHTSSWIAALRFVLEPRTGVEQAKSITSAIGLALLIPGLAWATWQSWRRPRQVAWHMLWLMLWFLFLCNPWFQPWYVLWVLALVAFQPERQRLTWSIILFGCTSMLTYIVAAFVFPELGWEGASVEWHASLSALIYLPPLLVLLWRDIMRLPSLLRPGGRLRRERVVQRGRNRATS